jgi:hypothetical protein
VVVLIDCHLTGNDELLTNFTVLVVVALVYASSGNSLVSFILEVVSSLDFLIANYTDTIGDVCVVTLSGEDLTLSVDVSAGCRSVRGEVLICTEGALVVIVTNLGVVSLALRLAYELNGGFAGDRSGVLKLSDSESSVVSLVILNGAVLLDYELSAILKGYSDLLAFELSAVSSEILGYLLVGSGVSVNTVNLENLTSGTVLNLCSTSLVAGSLYAGYDVLPCVCISRNSVSGSSGLISVGLATLSTLLISYLRAVGGLSCESGSTLVDNSGLESLAISAECSVAKCADVMLNSTGLLTSSSLVSNMLTGSCNVTLNTSVYVNSGAAGRTGVNVVRRNGAVTGNGNRSAERSI